MSEVTPEMIKKYVEHGGTKCLFCGNDDVTQGDIEGGPVEIDGPNAWQDVTCTACGEEWRDCYKLIGILTI